MTRPLALLLLLLSLLPAAACAQALAPPVEGVDYVAIPGGEPWLADGRIEVAELFAYTCHHCADFAPQLEAWKRRQPADVRVAYVPAAYDPRDGYARAYFAAEQLGVVGKLHAPLFRAIHEAQSVPMGNASDGELATFAADEGVDAAKFAAAMASPAVAAKMQRARAFAIASGMEGTPTLVVAGKYRVQARTHEDALRIAGQLVAMERAARKPR
ncbi:MAG TPA: thiol:disulfide interchange protein DsbA/DsbL [Luteimonas sp.]|nr:thiol:disulfide interchange protein DsbA/DsbL [Luteimonas sp.]